MYSIEPLALCLREDRSGCRHWRQWEDRFLRMVKLSTGFQQVVLRAVRRLLNHFPIKLPVGVCRAA